MIPVVFYTNNHNLMAKRVFLVKIDPTFILEG